MGVDYYVSNGCQIYRMGDILKTQATPNVYRLARSFILAARMTSILRTMVAY